MKKKIELNFRLQFRSKLVERESVIGIIQNASSHLEHNNDLRLGVLQDSTKRYLNK